MAKRKTAYVMSVNVLDTIGEAVDITEAQFKRTVESLMRQVENSRSNEEETFRAEFKDIVTEHEHYIERRFVATLGTTDIELVKVICKPGYCIA